MKKETLEMVHQLIRDKYLTESEFIVEVLAPEIDEEEFDVDELVDIMMDVRTERDYEMRQKPKCVYCNDTGEVATDEDDGEGHIMRGVGTEKCICQS